MTSDEKKFRLDLDEDLEAKWPNNPEVKAAARYGASWAFQWFARQSQWIQTSERLPEKFGFYSVILKTDSGIQIHGLWFENGTWFFDNDISQGEPIFTSSWYLEVIAWQPLPEPPKP